ncbi:MAG: disulfide bond formation protein B [Alphaproteobacteria bacterium]
MEDSGQSGQSGESAGASFFWLGGLTVLLPMFALGVAYGYFEWFLGLYPCTMCWWQRWAHFGALGLGVAGILTWKLQHRGGGKGRVWGYGLLFLSGVVLLFSGFLGLWHMLTEFGLIEVSVCSSSGVGDDFGALLDRPVVRCDRVPWSFLGLSIAGWNFVYSLLGSGLVFWLLWLSRGVFRRDVRDMRRGG